MSATAQGTTLRCDKHGCNAAATVDQDAWSFCADHAGARTPQPTARPRPVVDLDRLTPAEQQHGIRLTEHPATAGPIGMLLEQASGHSIGKVRRLAEKIEGQLDDLRALIAQHAADERRRQAEAAAKAKARAEVERLERELAAAKASLRGTPSPAARRAPRAPQSDAEPLTCQKGCGRKFSRSQGRGKHELSCPGRAA